MVSWNPEQSFLLQPSKAAAARFRLSAASLRFSNLFASTTPTWHQLNSKTAPLSCRDDALPHGVLRLKQFVAAEPSVLHQSLVQLNVAKDEGGHALHSAAVAAVR
jgi:hypothetical protein